MKKGKNTEQIIDDSILQLMELENVSRNVQKKLDILSCIGMFFIYLNDKDEAKIKELEQEFIIANVNNNISKTNKKIFIEAKEGLDVLQAMMKDKIQEIIVRKFIKKALKDISRSRELLKQEAEFDAEETRGKINKRELEDVDDFVSKRAKKEGSKYRGFLHISSK